MLARWMLAGLDAHRVGCSLLGVVDARWVGCLQQASWIAQPTRRGWVLAQPTRGVHTKRESDQTRRSGPADVYFILPIVNKTQTTQKITLLGSLASRTRQ